MNSKTVDHSTVFILYDKKTLTMMVKFSICKNKFCGMVLALLCDIPLSGVIR